MTPRLDVVAGPVESYLLRTASRIGPQRGGNKRTMVLLTAVLVLVGASCGGGNEPQATRVDALPSDVSAWPDATMHGFSFPNFTAQTYEEVVFDESDMVMLFGAGTDVCASGSTDDCLLTAEAAQFAQMVNVARSWGHCEGFSILAAERFNAGLSPASYELANEPEVLKALMRGVASQFLPEVQAEADRWAREDLRDKVLHIQESLTAGTLNMSVGIYTNDAGHSLLPYQVTWNGDDFADIWVYDSNRPAQTVSIGVDLAEGRWEFPYVGGETWSGPSNMLDLVSVADRSGKCPFCSDAVSVSRAAFYVRSESPNVAVSIDDAPVPPDTVSDAVTYRPMKGRSVINSAAEDPSEGTYRETGVTFRQYHDPLSDIESASRRGVYYSRVSADIGNGQQVRVSTDSAAIIFAVSDHGLQRFVTDDGGSLSMDSAGVSASGGQLTVTAGDSLVQIDGLDASVSNDLSFVAEIADGVSYTGDLDDGHAIRLVAEPTGGATMVRIDTSGNAAGFNLDREARVSSAGPAPAFPTREVAFDLTSVSGDLATEFLPVSPVVDSPLTSPQSSAETPTSLPATAAQATTPTTTTPPATTTTAPPATTTTTTPPATTTTTTTTPPATTTTTTTVPPIAATASLTFDANGGSGAPAVVVDDPGATVSVAETSPQRSGFGFNGWNTDAGGTGTAYASGDDYTLPANDGDVDTLFAQWDPVDYTYVAGTALDSNGALQDGSVVELDITVSPGERFILSNDYLMALMSSFASAGSSEHIFIGVPAPSFDATSVAYGDFLSVFKIYRQNATNLMFEQYNNGSVGASLSRSSTALSEDAVFELSNSGELTRLFNADMDNTLTEDVPSGTRHDIGNADTTPRSIYIAAVGKGLTLPATSIGAYKIAIPKPTPDMLTYAGNIDSLIADNTSDLGHIAVNTSGDVFSVTRGSGDAWISKHDSSGVEQWRVATPVTGDAFLAAASDGGLYIGGLDPVSGNAGVVKLDGDGNVLWSQFTSITAGTVEIDGLDVLEGSPDSGAVFVGKVNNGNGATVTYGTTTAVVPTGHAEYLAHIGADGTPVMVDVTERSATQAFRGFTAVDARPNGSGAWWIATAGTQAPNASDVPVCLRFTYDPTLTPPLTVDWYCGSSGFSYDVALLSDGSVAAANYSAANQATLQRFNASDGSEDWAVVITDDSSVPSPANSRGLEVDSTDGIYYAARTVGMSTTITDSAPTSTVISFTDSAPNGLLIKFNSSGDYQWSRTVGSGASTKASTVAVSGTTVYLGTSANALVQFDAYRERYTWKPAIFVLNANGVSHK